MGTRLTRRALPEDLPDWGVLLLESHHDPAFTMEWRTHPFHKWIYVLRGRGRFFLNRSDFLFSAGDVIAVPAGTPNRIVDLPGAASSLYVCCVADQLLSFDRSLRERLPAGPLTPDGHFANRVAALMRRLAFAQSRATPTRPVGMVADALRMVQLAAEHELTSPPPPVTRRSPERQAMAEYVRRLRANFFEATTLDDAAAGLGISRRTFTRLFAETTGTSWLRFIRDLAIDHAQERLRGSDLPIASVAFECGFNDLSTFYRHFKQRCGRSPAAYRRRPDAAESLSDQASSDGDPPTGVA